MCWLIFIFNPCFPLERSAYTHKMPPKFDPTDPEVVKLIELFQSIGFTKAKATENVKSAKNASALKDIIEKNGLSNKGLDDKKATLVSGLAIQGAKLGDAEKSYVVDAILSGRLKSAEQVSGELLVGRQNARIQTSDSCREILGRKGITPR